MQPNETQFTDLLAAHAGIIHKVANAYCRHLDDRNDLIQEITLQLWKSWGNYRHDYKVSTWMYRIALNVAISFYRKHHRHKTLHYPLNDDFFAAEDHPAHVEENIQQLYHFISKMNALNKALILLYLDQYSYEDMAATLGISKTNVATRIGRIKQQLKKEFNLLK